jgi:FeS assembly SUF system protein
MMEKQTPPDTVEETETGQELDSQQQAELKQQVIAALRTVFDPEIPVNIYDMGLIYRLDLSSSGFVEIDMTLTSPACPVAGSLPGQVEAAARSVAGVQGVRLELVWDPPWSMDKMSEEAKLELGFL